MILSLVYILSKIFENSLTSWTAIMAIASVCTAMFTILMAVAILITAIIAKNTLVTNKETKMEELSTKMARTWYDGKYGKKLVNLSALHSKVVSKEYNKDIMDWTAFETQFDLRSLENFIYKLNYFIDSNRLSLENIYIDFYDIFSLHTQSLMTAVYGELKWAHNWMKFGKPYDGKSVIDIFFKKLAKHLNYRDLINYIEK